VVDFALKGKQKDTSWQDPSSSVYKTSWMQRGVQYDQKGRMQNLVSNYFPDFRRVLNECQRYSASGTIDAGVLATFSDVSVNDLTKNSEGEELSRGSQMGCI
jgi:hypothetical protein